MDVSSRIIVSLFDFLSHKEIDINLLYELMEDPDSLAVVPDSMRALPGFVSWSQYGKLIDAFVKAIGSDDWASDFVGYSLKQPALWTQVPRLAAPHMDDPARLLRFLAHWFPRFEMPAVEVSANGTDDLFQIKVRISRQTGLQHTFRLLGELFRHVPGLVGTSLPHVSMKMDRDSCLYELTSADGSGRFRQTGNRFFGFFSRRPRTDALHEFYSRLLTDYETVTQEIAVGPGSRTTDKGAKQADTEAQAVFVNRISHELRTPLKSILGFVELLQTRVVSAEKKKHIWQQSRETAGFCWSGLTTCLTLRALKPDKKCCNLNHSICANPSPCWRRRWQQTWRHGGSVSRSISAICYRR